MNSPMSSKQIQPITAANAVIQACRFSARNFRSPSAKPQFTWRERSNGVSLGRAKADSPSPRDGPKHPVPEIGSRALPRNFQTGGGRWQDRVNMMGCISTRNDGKILWMRYRDRER